MNSYRYCRGSILKAVGVLITLCMLGSQIPVKLANAQPIHPLVVLDDAPVEFPLDPYIENGITMVPLRALAEALQVKVSWDSATNTAICKKGASEIKLTIGDSRAVVSGRYVNLPATITLVNGHTVVPLRFFSEVMGYEVSWDQENFTVLVKSSPQPCEVWGFYALGSKEYSSWSDLFGKDYPYVAGNSPATKMAGIFLGWYAVNADGTVTSTGHPSGFMRPDGWPAVLVQARVRNLKTYGMVFADNGNGMLSGLLADQVLRSKLVLEAAKVAKEHDGVLIDFEELQEQDKDAFGKFIVELRGVLGDKKLAVALPPLNSSWKGYDHQLIGKNVDVLVLMAYGYEDPLTPGSAAPWKLVDEAVKLEINYVERDKLILGIPGYGTLYKNRTLEAKIPLKDSSRFPGAGITPTTQQFDYNMLSTCVTWRENDADFEGYFETHRSLNARILLAQRYGLKGVAVWRLGLLGESWRPNP